MTRFLDSLSGTLAGMLIGVLLMAVIVPQPFTWSAAPRPALQAEPPILPGGMTTEGPVSLPSPDSAGRTGMPWPVLRVAIAAPSPSAAPLAARSIAPSVTAQPMSAAVDVPSAAAGTITPVAVKGSWSAAGVASFVARAYGARYLALPAGPGVTARICGPAACVVATSNDAGPDLSMQRNGRIVDLSFALFKRVCGCDPWAVGLVRVTVEER